MLAATMMITGTCRRCPPFAPFLYFFTHISSLSPSLTHIHARARSLSHKTHTWCIFPLTPFPNSPFLSAHSHFFFFFSFFSFFSSFLSFLSGSINTITTKFADIQCAKGLPYYFNTPAKGSVCFNASRQVCTNTTKVLYAGAGKNVKGKNMTFAQKNGCSFMNTTVLGMKSIWNPNVAPWVQTLWNASHKGEIQVFFLIFFRTTTTFFLLVHREAREWGITSPV